MCCTLMAPRKRPCLDAALIAASSMARKQASSVSAAGELGAPGLFGTMPSSAFR